METERRFFAGEVRAQLGEGDTPATRIVGHGAVFNRRSENLGGFREVIMPGAFDGVLQDDVRALFNHDSNFVLGRSLAKTLELSIDSDGLRYDILAPDTQTIRDLVLAPLQRGDISQSSFQFRVARDGENWFEDEDGVIVREIHKVARLYDVGPVTFPAYPDAGSAARSLQHFISERDLKSALNQKRSRERLLTILGA